MKQAVIPKEWPQRLGPLLTGRTLTAYSRGVPEDAKESYPELKEALLNALGLSVTVQTRHLESQKDARRNIPRDSP